MEQQSDFFLNILSNDFSGKNFSEIRAQGMDFYLKPFEEYKANDTIRQSFTKQGEDGKPVFDEESLKKAYETSLRDFNAYQNASYSIGAVDNLLPDTELNRASGLAVNKKPIKFNFNAYNPYKITQGYVGINQMSEREYSAKELASMNPYIRDKKGNIAFQTKDGDAISGFNDWFDIDGKAVLARHEEDGVDKWGNEFKKGDYKVDENGNFYYRFLEDGESVTGKEQDMMSFWDNTTDDGSFANKFDFMDSDDMNKSITGSIMREVATYAPMFIPYVGPVYTAALLGKNFLASGAQMWQSLAGIAGSDAKGAKDLQSWLAQYSTTVAENEQDPFSVGGMVHMIGNIFGEVATQRALSQLPFRLAAWKNPQDVYTAMKSGNLLTNAIKSADDVAVLMKDAAKLQQALGKDKFEKLQTLTSGLGTLYNAIYASGEIAKEAEKLGLTPRETGFLQVAAAGALGTLYRISPFEKWIERGFGLNEQNEVAKRALQATLGQIDVGKLRGPEAAKEVVGFGQKFMNIMKKGFDIGKKAVNTSIEAKGIAGAAGAEAIEEVTEVGLNESFKLGFNGWQALGLTTTKDKSFTFDPKEIGQNLLLSAVGGAIGGGLAKKLYDIPDLQTRSLDELQAAGHTDKLLENLEEMRRKGKLAPQHLSTEWTVDSEGNRVYKPTTDASNSLNEYMYNIMKKQIINNQKMIDMMGIGDRATMAATYMTKLANGEELADDEMLFFQNIASGMNVNMENFLDFKENTSVINDHNSLVADALSLSKEIKNLETAIASTDAKDIEGVKAELAKKQEQLKLVNEELAEFGKIINGEKTDLPDYYFRQALTVMRPDLYNAFGVKTREDFAMTNFKSPYKDLTETQKQEVDAQYADYVKNRKGRDIKKAMKEMEDFAFKDPFAKMLEKNADQIAATLRAQQVNNIIALFAEHNFDGYEAYKKARENANDYNAEYTMMNAMISAKLDDMDKYIMGKYDRNEKLTEEENNKFDIAANSALDNFSDSLKTYLEKEKSLTGNVQIDKVVDEYLDLSDIIALREEVQKVHIEFTEKHSQIHSIASVELIEGDDVLGGLADDNSTSVLEYHKYHEEIIQKLELMADNVLEPLLPRDENGVVLEPNEEQRALLENTIEPYQNFINDQALHDKWIESSKKYSDAKESLKAKLNKSLDKLDKQDLVSSVRQAYDKLNIVAKEKELRDRASTEGINFVDKEGTEIGKLDKLIASIDKHQAYLKMLTEVNPLINAYRERNKNKLYEKSEERVRVIHPDFRTSASMRGMASNELAFFRKRFMHYKNLLLENEKYQIENIKKITVDNYKKQVAKLRDMFPVEKETPTLDAFKMDEKKVLDGETMGKIRQELADFYKAIKAQPTLAEQIKKLQDMQEDYDNGLLELTDTVYTNEVMLGLLVSINRLNDNQINDFHALMHNFLSTNDWTVSPVYPQELALFNVFAFMANNDGVPFSENLLEDLERIGVAYSNNIIAINQPAGAGKTSTMLPFTVLFANHFGRSTKYFAPHPDNLSTLEKAMENTGAQSGGLIEDVLKLFDVGPVNTSYSGIAGNSMKSLKKTNTYVKFESESTNFNPTDPGVDLIILDEYTHMDYPSALALSRAVEAVNEKRKAENKPSLLVVFAGDSAQDGVSQVVEGPKGKETRPINAKNLKIQEVPRVRMNFRTGYSYLSNPQNEVERLANSQLVQNNNIANLQLKARNWEDDKSMFGVFTENFEERAKKALAVANEKKEKIVFITNNPDYAKSLGFEPYQVTTPDKVQGREWEYVIIDSFNWKNDNDTDLRHFFTLITRPKNAIVLNKANLGKFSFSSEERDMSPRPDLQYRINSTTVKALKEFNIESLKNFSMIESSKGITTTESKRSIPEDKEKDINEEENNFKQQRFVFGQESAEDDGKSLQVHSFYVSGTTFNAFKKLFPANTDLSINQIIEYYKNLIVSTDLQTANKYLEARLKEVYGKDNKVTVKGARFVRNAPDHKSLGYNVDFLSENNKVVELILDVDGTEVPVSLFALPNIEQTKAQYSKADINSTLKKYGIYGPARTLYNDLEADSQPDSVDIPFADIEPFINAMKSAKGGPLRLKLKQSQTFEELKNRQPYVRFSKPFIVASDPTQNKHQGRAAVMYTRFDTTHDLDDMKVIDGLYDSWMTREPSVYNKYGVIFLDTDTISFEELAAQYKTISDDLRAAKLTDDVMKKVFAEQIDALLSTSAKKNFYIAVKQFRDNLDTNNALENELKDEISKILATFTNIETLSYEFKDFHISKFMNLFISQKFNGFIDKFSKTFANGNIQLYKPVIAQKATLEKGKYQHIMEIYETANTPITSLKTTVSHINMPKTFITIGELKKMLGTTKPKTTGTPPQPPAPTSGSPSPTAGGSTGAPAPSPYVQKANNLFNKYPNAFGNNPQKDIYKKAFVDWFSGTQNVAAFRQGSDVLVDEILASNPSAQGLLEEHNKLMEEFKKACNL